jgi:hypothetical protein
VSYDRAVRTALFLLLAACSFDHGVAPRDGGGSDGGGSGSDGSMMGSDGGGSDGSMSTLRQKTITIGNSVNGTLADFPLWISLTDLDVAARARPDGADIHFTAGAQKLDYQIQSWTKNTGRLDAWVRVPSLAAGTQIAMRYGDAAAAHAPNPPATFAGYAAVWHLDDQLNNSTIADARNQTNGTAVMLSNSDSTTGQLGRGIDFQDGADAITFTNPLSGNTPHTISVWINQRVTATNDAIIVMGNAALDQARWFHSRYNQSTIAVGFYTNDYADPNENIIGGGWVLLDWVFEGQNRMTRLYRDGQLVAGPFQHGNGINTQGTEGMIGNASAGFGSLMGLNATLDEIRIINVARSADWIAAEYANQKTPTSFYSVSQEQTPPP